MSCVRSATFTRHFPARDAALYIAAQLAAATAAALVLLAAPTYA